MSRIFRALSTVFAISLFCNLLLYAPVLAGTKVDIVSSPSLQVSMPMAEDDSGEGFITDQDTPFITANVLVNDSQAELYPFYVAGYNASAASGVVEAIPGSTWLMDTTFGERGTSHVNLGTAHTELEIIDMALQPDGKIVQCGTMTFSPIASQQDKDLVLIRLNNDGSVDHSFGASGSVVVNNAGSMEACRHVFVQMEGTILAGGIRYPAGASNSPGTTVLWRFHSNGSPDAAFGVDGILNSGLPAHTLQAEDIAVQGDGRILVSFTQDNFTALARLMPDGRLDTSFDQDGILITDLIEDIRGRSISIQPDGKILIGGQLKLAFVYQAGLIRYEVDGTHDASFGQGGVLSDARFQTVIELLVLPNGKILASGFPHNSGSSDTHLLAQYQSTGMVDSNFGTNGFIQSHDTPVSDLVVFRDGTIIGRNQSEISQYHPDGTPVWPLSPLDNNPPGYWISAMLVQPDGKLVVGGVSQMTHSSVARLLKANPAGGVDGSFGKDGWVPFAEEDLLTYGNVALISQPDGKILMGANYGLEAEERISLTRFLPNGFLDSSFGTDGRVLLETLPGYPEYPWWPFDSFALQADGKILVSGQTPNSLVLIRLNTDGSYDTSFAGDGVLVVGNFSVHNSYVAVQSNHRILLAFLKSTIGSGEPFEVRGFLDNGLVDTSFGSDGTAGIRVPSGYVRDVYSLIVQQDDRILLSGNIVPAVGPAIGFVTRMMADGQFDPTFDGDGKLILEHPSGMSNLALQPDGKILVALKGADSGSPLFQLLRMNTDGSPDAAFGASGFMEGDPEFNPTTLAVQADGKLLVSGEKGLNRNFQILRFTASGKIDVGFGQMGIADAYLAGNRRNLLVVQPDGKIISGTTWVIPFILRLHSEPAARFYYDPNGTFDYLNPGETATDTFSYTLHGEGGASTANVTITIVGTNDTPLAHSRMTATREDAAVDVLLTADDEDDQPLSYQVVDHPGHGTLTGEAPNLTYTPAADWHGTDYFTFKASDGSAESEPAIMTLAIEPVNDAPEAGDILDIAWTAGKELFLPMLVFSDPDGDALVYSARLSGGASLPAWLSIDPQSGYMRGTPRATDSGIFEILVTASDSKGGCADVRFTLTVSSEDDPQMLMRSYLPLVRQ